MRMIVLIVIFRIISVVQILLHAAIPIKTGTPNPAVHLDLQKKNSEASKGYINLKWLI
jgi:hypothetical protein